MPWTDAELAHLVGRDIEEGWVVNLGIGLPTTVIDELYGRDVMVHAENGIIGLGPPPSADAEDVDVVNPGKQFATLVPGGAFIDSVISFTLMRSGRLDLAVVGAYQVSFTGDLANWRLPRRKIAGIGGAADLAVGARRIWVMMKFRGPDGSPKLMPACDYPLTARGVVQRVYTDQGVVECGPRGATLIRAAPDVDEQELRQLLAASNTGHPAIGHAVGTQGAPGRSSRT